MTSEGLREMFEGNFADTCAEKFPLMLMGGRAIGQACADGDRGPTSVSAKLFKGFHPILLVSVGCMQNSEP